MAGQFNPVVPARDRIFDQLAAGHDQEVLRYTAFCADRLVHRLHPAAGEKILDVATGTGSVALAAAQAVGPDGRVTAIDTVEPMLARLEAKIGKFGLANIDVHDMDGAHLGFRRDYFHHVVCSLGLFWFSEPMSALREWWRVARPGGGVIFTTFAANVFAPLLGHLRRTLEQRGMRITVPWESLSDQRVLESLMHAAGFEDVDISEEQLGYHLKDVHQWWEVAQHSGLLSLIDPLPTNAIGPLQSAHMTEVESVMTADGLWLDVPVLFVCGRKPAAGKGVGSGS
jgi:ubiquinone/menaquinone biosynthesis C-methylase UbiE